MSVGRVAAQDDMDGFFTELGELIRDDQGGFVTYGASRLAWEITGPEILNRPSTVRLVDAAIDFRLECGMTPIRDFTGYERDRYYQRPTETEQ